MARRRCCPSSRRRWPPWGTKKPLRPVDAVTRQESLPLLLGEGGAHFPRQPRLDVNAVGAAVAVTDAARLVFEPVERARAGGQEAERVGMQ
jgi:hypothetical protein